jgi:hypothetical protein
MGEVDKHRLLQGILRLDAEIANVLSSWRPEARQREIREDFAANAMRSLDAWIKANFRDPRVDHPGIFSRT